MGKSGRQFRDRDRRRREKANAKRRWLNDQQPQRKKAA